MSKTKEVDIFLEKQKIPSKLSDFFEVYIQTGDYENLIKQSCDYIKKDNEKTSTIIHNLRLEKNRMDIGDKNKSSLINPMAASLFGALFAFLFTWFGDFALRQYGDWVDNIIVPLALVICAGALCMFFKLLMKTIKEDTTKDLHNREKIDFLDFCIAEYNKK